MHVAPTATSGFFTAASMTNRPATPPARAGDANPPILEFNLSGKLLRGFGVGLFAYPHGFTVDKRRKPMDERHKR